jgi:hypothetical protein
MLPNKVCVTTKEPSLAPTVVHQNKVFASKVERLDCYFHAYFLSMADCDFDQLSLGACVSVAEERLCQVTEPIIQRLLLWLTVR